MKKICLLLFAAGTAAAAQSQTLFTYGNEKVSKQEFLKAYNKNKTPVEDREKSLKEYLELYSRFKLKVKAARDMKLDTLEQLGFDLQNFRSQVEEGYLTDEKEMNRMVDEAVGRSQKDIHLLHFYIPIAGKMPAEDTMKAVKAMNELREELEKGKTDYNELVDEISKEIMVIKGRDLGYITVFSLPYEMENLVYSLKPGEVSKLYRTKKAWHVFKVADERPSAGRWRTAQILLAVPPDVAGDKLKATEKLADSLYDALKKGADFAALAKQYSDDKLTYMNGGEMQEFGTGRYELPFEKAVFALKKDGDITEPLFTEYGFHIVKRLQQKPTPSDKSDENFVNSIKQQITQDARVEIVKQKFLKQMQAKTGYKKNALVKDEQLFRYADSTAANREVKNYPVSKQVIFSFAKSNVKGSDWLNFVKDYKLNQDVYKGENNRELLDKYISVATQEYYRKHLEDFNEDFKYQIQEFKEGNMLFEIMERNVWSKAAGDSDGLKKFYEADKAAYKWAESAEVILFNCSSEAAANEAAKSLSEGKEWKKIADESEGRVQADSSRYELNQLVIPHGTMLKEGLVTAPVVNNMDNTASFVKVLKLYPASQQRSFEEARGLVINNYQNHLEEKWVEGLKKKYPVKVDEAVFRSMLK